MSVMRCEHCEQWVDTQAEEMFETRHGNVCVNCMEETVEEDENGGL